MRALTIALAAIAASSLAGAACAEDAVSRAQVAPAAQRLDMASAAVSTAATHSTVAAAQALFDVEWLDWPLEGAGPADRLASATLTGVNVEDRIALRAERLVAELKITGPAPAKK